VFFSLLIAGLAGRLPGALDSGLRAQGVSAGVAQHVASLPPVSTVFSAFLGINPIETLLKPYGTLDQVSAGQRSVLTGKEFFPHLISSAFHHGLVIVFATAAGMSLLAAIASALRGTPKPTLPDPDPAPEQTPARPLTKG